VLLADAAFDAQERGDHFPHPSVEAHAEEYVRTQNERLMGLVSLAFVVVGFGYGYFRMLYNFVGTRRILAHIQYFFLIQYTSGAGPLQFQM